MSAIEDFAVLQQNVSTALINTTRATTTVCAEDIDFYRSSQPINGRRLDQQNAKLLALTEKLLHCSDTEKFSKSFDLSDHESIDNNWRAIAERVDVLLERVDTFLDEFNGLVKPPSELSASPPTEQWGRTPGRHRLQVSSIVKPQLSFEVLPPNNENKPFKPLLSLKPHFQIPLDRSLELYAGADGRLHYQHPYAEEIKNYHYPLSNYTHTEPIAPKNFEDTTATYVDDFGGVQTMLNALKQASEIAVDLEHHDTHSYLGIVCLMQISTRDSDWIIDTLKPWRRKLEILNEVFADPKIIKVFHGAQMDVLWLQRDLGLYIVGLFDTYHVSRVLGYPSGSLAFLLKKFVNFDAQKQYQTADWRQRPLPQEMLHYARSDTHFLLYIFDLLKNELIAVSDFDVLEKDQMLAVLDKSKDTSLQKYEYPFYDSDLGLGPGGYLGLLQRNPLNLDRQSFLIFRRLHRWRDDLARSEDESVHQVLSNHALFALAESKPENISGILSKLRTVSTSVRQKVSELLIMIQTSKTDAESEPTLAEFLSKASRFPRVSVSGEYDKTSVGPPLTKNYLDARRSNLRAVKSEFWGSTTSSHLGVQHSLTNTTVTPANFLSTVVTDIQSPTLVEAERWSSHSKTARQLMGTFTIASRSDLPIEDTSAEGFSNANAKRKDDSPHTLARKAQRASIRALDKGWQASQERPMYSADSSEADTKNELKANRTSVDYLDYTKAHPILEDSQTAPMSGFSRSIRDGGKDDKNSSIRKSQSYRAGKRSTFK